jgi:hypothetical protein
VEGDLFGIDVAAIVNSDQTNFVLAKNESTISRQIRRRLGRDIQEELDEQTGGISLPPGTVLAANLENALDEALNRDDAKLTLTSRLIFADACSSMTWALYHYSTGPLLRFAADALREGHPPFPDCLLYLQRKPLP